MTQSNTTAVICDMDGVIADTAPYHLASWQEVFSKRGIRYNEQDFREGFGQKNEDIIPRIIGEKTASKEINAIAKEKEQIFRRDIRTNLKALPGVIKLMESLAENGFKMALASSAPIENIPLITRRQNIYKAFTVIVSGEVVTEGKPNPQVFLLAAHKLGVKPANCVVIEDAVAGIVAAKAAGMRCIAVTNSHPRSSLKQADLIVDSLETVTLRDIQRLLSLSK